MPAATLDLRSAQMTMPGISFPRRSTRRSLSSAALTPGQVVQYHGRIRGGPRFGLSGTVVETRLKQAVVDMGAHGRWNIPYYLLSLPQPAFGGYDAVQVA